MWTQKRNKFVLITTGDPHGIGPELILKGLEPKHYANCLVLGCVELYQFYQSKIKTKHLFHWVNKAQKQSFDPQKLNIYSIPYPKINLGSICPKAGAWSLKVLDQALAFVQTYEQVALVTGPVHKEAIIKSGQHFIGHTEYLAEHFRQSCVRMLMYSPKIKVVLVTNHLPLTEVAPKITQETIWQTLRLSHDFLKKSGIKKAVLGVSAFNPHQGEGGFLGTEETEIIKAITKAQAYGLLVEGPISADSLFCNSSRYDLFVAMYHDQGLIPYKIYSQKQGINITLGLPMLRVSVDHGPALDIAGQGIADPSSFKNAVSYAITH